MSTRHLLSDALQSIYIICSGKEKFVSREFRKENAKILTDDAWDTAKRAHLTQ